MERRTLLQWMAVLAAAPITAEALAKGTPVARSRLVALAEVVFPEALGTAGRAAAVDAFVDWLRDYRAGAEGDHGYGVTSLAVLPASPAARYAAQCADLDRRAGGAFTTASLETRRSAVAAALEAGGFRTLPDRPDGGHVALDLMAHWFQSPAATDVAYGRRIDRFGCNGLPGSDEPPPRLDGVTP